jgi:hypothetical protein
MRKRIALFVAVICIGLVSGLRSASAQDESKKEAPAQSRKFEPVQPYRLDFAFNEVSDGKVLNTRHYSMNLTASESNEIKIGTRVPVAAASSTNSSASAQVQYQYLDVGTNIWAQLREHGEELLLVVRSDVSNLDTSNESEHTSVSLPIVRQIKISGSTLLVVGKPILIGSMDDPNSKRQFQLEVTVTKLK